MKSVRIKREKVIAKIDEHIQAILDSYTEAMKKYEVAEAAYQAALPKFNAAMAAWHRRVADALDGITKDTVKFGDRNYGSTTVLFDSKKKQVLKPTPPVVPVKPVNPESTDYYTAYRALATLRGEKDLLAASEDDTITVSHSNFAALFQASPGSLDLHLYA